MAGKFSLLTTITSLATVCAVAAPTVDLGYAIHRPSILKAPESSHVYYDFSNIRYAAPPLGPLRFVAPLPPPENRSAGIQDGSYGNVCPQAYPKWLATALKVNNVSYYNGIGNGQTESEDCLFLDVFVPEKVFTNAELPKPVLIWLYGGGWVSGDKKSLTDPIGLLERAQQDLIFVAPNYRVSLFFQRHCHPK
jgi:carboxylesterase type B